MLCDFVVMVDAMHRKNIEQWRHTRLIVGALTGQDARHIIELPGDFDELNDIPETKKVEQMFRAEKTFEKIEHGNSSES